MTNTRPEFLARLDVLVAAFEKSNMPKDWIPLQLMNDFPQWTNEEMDSVATKTGVERASIQYVYDTIHFLVREPVRVAQLNLKLLKETVAKANETKTEKRDRKTEESHKAAANAANATNAWLDQMYRQWQARQQAGTAPPPPTPPPRANTDWGFHFSQFGQHVNSHAGKPWAKAPGYIQNACAVLEIPWPSTPEAAKKCYHSKAKVAHPDAGGKAEDFKKVQDAWELLEEYFRTHK